ncbi:exported hypothetical protein [Candidatus Magnetomoraceae bacterium gMMP-1]
MKNFIKIFFVKALIFFILINNLAAQSGHGDEGFETGDFTGLPWITGGDESWLVQDDEQFTGRYAARAPDSLRNNELSYMEITLNTDSGLIEFYYKVSSEVNCDFLIFKINNMKQDSWSGDINWTSQSYSVEAGRNTFRWEYIKDPLTSIREDTCWIDNITFPFGTRNISVFPMDYNFGDSIVNEVYKTFIITNTSREDLVIKEVAKNNPLSQPFEIISDECSNTTLAPVKSCDLRVSFLPVVPGHFSNSFDIPSNALNITSAEISVSGTSPDESFETGDFNNFLWKTGGSGGPWIIEDSITHSGGYAAQAPYSTYNNQSSYLELTVYTIDGSMSFYHKVSCEQNGDYLRFKIDGIEQEKWSGESDWTYQNYNISAGEHTFRWEYTKNRTQSEESDICWIDSIIFPLGSCAIYVRPASYSFDNSVATSKNQTVSIKNKGNENLIIGQIASIDPLSHPFGIIEDNCSNTTLVPLESCTLTPYFSPDSIGIFNESFDIPSNSINAPNIKISLTGDSAEGFETGDLSHLEWTTDQDNPWIVQDAVKQEGNYSAQSPDINNNESSYLELALETIEGTMSFYYKVSSEDDADFLTFGLDGKDMDSWSGEVAWTYQSYSISSGLHFFRWEYKKNSTQSNGSDACWIDRVKFPAITLNLQRGWNLISLPVMPENSGFKQLFNDAEVAYEFKDGAYNSVNTLNPGIGYWIKVPFEKTYSIGGEIFEHYERSLSPGWHLIGAVNKTAKPVTNPDKCIEVIYGFADGTYYFVNNLEPGYGYWVKILQNCVFNMQKQ